MRDVKVRASRNRSHWADDRTQYRSSRWCAALDAALQIVLSKQKKGPDFSGPSS